LLALIGIAKGVAYLHENVIVHNDLKADKIMLDRGVCKIRGSALSFHTLVGGDGNIQAPECQARFAPDVYGFGGLMCSMVKGGALPGRLHSTQPLELFGDIPDSFVLLMNCCLDLNHSKRPSADAVLKQLEALLDSDVYSL